jgi:hypothetical protein
MKGIIVITLLLISNYLCFADDIKKPTPPKPPTEPVKPVVPGSPEDLHYPRFPSLPPLPAIPDRNNQNNEPVREIDKYELNISEAFPNGDTRRNVANTISNAHYTLYSNGNILLKLKFRNDLEYSYHLRNSRSKMEISSGVFRKIYDIIIQVDKKFLLEQYIGELYNNDESITSLNIFGNNKIIVILNFIKKPSS